MKSDYEWIKQCIHSCLNPWQLECAMVMIQLFEKKHADGIRETDDLHNLIIQKSALMAA